MPRYRYFKVPDKFHEPYYHAGDFVKVDTEAEDYSDKHVVVVDEKGYILILKYIALEQRPDKAILSFLRRRQKHLLVSVDKIKIIGVVVERVHG